MRRQRLLLSGIALLLLACSSFALAQNDAQGGGPLSAKLTGAAEVPGPGDADGTGTASISLDQGKICFELSVSNIATATAAHIHRGKAGEAGPPVVTLAPPPAEGSSKNCVDASADLIKEIWQTPENFYINVHNAEFPNGAVRGQLSK